MFEQNRRPYGKIEDGLPRWHVALREKEYETIGEQALAAERRRSCRAPRSAATSASASSTDDWGFTRRGARLRRVARPPAADRGRRRLRRPRPRSTRTRSSSGSTTPTSRATTGPCFEPRDGALVVGGGLASIDVVKVLMLETTRAKLRERGIEVRPGRARGEGHPEDRSSATASRSRTSASRAARSSTGAATRTCRSWRCPRTPTRSDARRCTRGAQKMLEKAMEKYRFKFEPLCRARRPDRRGRAARGPALPPHAHRGRPARRRSTRPSSGAAAT